MRTASDSQHAESANGYGSYSAASTSYDVFINHRGPDTKNIFVSHLAAALKGQNLKPFVDKSIEEGKHAFKEIDAAIRDTPVLLAIFSCRYAESEYCLNELVAMMDRKEKEWETVTVLPVFFDVSPGDLRHAGSSHDNPFFSAFENHRRQNCSKTLISKWKAALIYATQFKGFELARCDGDTNDLKNRIVNRVQELVRPERDLGSTSQDNRRLAESSDIASTSTPRAQQVDRFERNLGSTSQDNRCIAQSSEIAHTSTPEAQQEDVKYSLRILVIGNSVDRVVNYFCGEGRRQTRVQNFLMGWTSSPPMCLYHHSDNAHDQLEVLETLMKNREERWSRKHVVSSCVDKIHQRRQCESPSNHGDLRLHMVWFVCQRCSDLPNDFEWTEIMKTLSDLPIQIVVTPGETLRETPEESPRETLESEFKKIRKQGNCFFPNSQNLDELILKLEMGLTDWDPNKYLSGPWKSRVRAEIANIASIIWEIRKELGPKGISIPGKVGNRGTPRKRSLLMSGEFFHDFLKKYWEVPQSTYEGVLNELRPSYNHGPLSYQFVKFCLQAAAIILYSMPSYGDMNDDCNWRDITSECYNRYFRGTDRIDGADRVYDAMKCDEIQAFLLQVFEREDFIFRTKEGEHRSCCLRWGFIRSGH